jgi:hypothetical protein
MNQGWIGVDLDGTLAQYAGWNGGAIGDPVPLMAARVRQWINEGKDVRIFTARVFDQDQKTVSKIQDWCALHVGARLPVTNRKDYAMIELWDDRAIQVVPNTGERVDGADIPLAEFPLKV